jgi:hypothetical protein
MSVTHAVFAVCGALEDCRSAEEFGRSAHGWAGEWQDFLGVAIVGSGDRVLVDQSKERLPVCHRRQSGPTPNEAIRCRSKATKAERSAVGKG